MDVVDRSTKYGSLEIQNESSVSRASTSLWLWINFTLCIIVGPMNFILYKVMYSAYGDSRAYFVSQGVNFLYVLYGGVILSIGHYRGIITDEPNLPHTKFIIMGFLDCLGGFLAAMGANETSGSLQQLLNQTLIPFTMILSRIMLGKKSTGMQIFGSILIIFGAAIVILSSNSSSTDGNSSNYSWSFISNLVYLSSNIPIGLSCVYKELGFRDLHIHVMHMTQWVSIYQLLWGFVLGFLQLIPGMGSMSGISVSEMRSSFYSGMLCYLHIDGECAERNTFWLLTGYCIINFLFNIVGLNLVKYDSAVLSNLTSALVLPLTVLMFSMPILGAYREPYCPNTILALIVVMFGFLCWRMKYLPYRLVCCPTVIDSSENENLVESPTRLSDSNDVAHSPDRTALEGYRDIEHEAVTCGCGMVYHHVSRSEHVEHVESFSDRVIFLSLDE
jgi:drug/metabolite transporter (DMT)-like permease